MLHLIVYWNDRLSRAGLNEKHRFASTRRHSADEVRAFRNALRRPSIYYPSSS